MADNIYYHANRKPKNLPPDSTDYGFMEERESIKIGDEENLFTRALKNDIPFDFFGSESFPENPSFDNFLEYFLAGDYNEREGFVKLLYKPLALYLKLVSELVLESIRFKEFNARPSRQRCLWLVETPEDAANWAKHTAHDSTYQIVKVAVKGNVFKCDSSLIEYTNESLFDMEERARLYWRGEDRPFEREEILFEGDVEVIEVLSSDKP